MDGEYLTPKQLVNRYQNSITERTLANWRSRGDGPPFTKIGGKVLYALGDVVTWEQARRMLCGWGQKSAAMWMLFGKGVLAKTLHTAALLVLMHLAT